MESLHKNLRQPAFVNCQEIFDKFIVIRLNSLRDFFFITITCLQKTRNNVKNANVLACDIVLKIFSCLNKKLKLFFQQRTAFM